MGDNLFWHRVVHRVSVHAFLMAAILTECVVTLAVGQSRLPIRQFGDSEFRLTAKGGSERAFRFSPDGKMVAGANGEEVKLWSFPEGKLLHDFSGQIQTNCIGFALEGRQLLALYQRRMEIYRFDVETGELLSRTKLADYIEEESETHYDMPPDGKWFILRDGQGNVSVWDTAEGKLHFRKQVSHGNDWCTITNPVVLNVWGTGLIGWFDLNSGEQVKQTKAPRNLSILARTPRGTIVAGYSSTDRAIIFWDTTNDRQIGGKIPLAEEYRGGVPESAISADGRRFVFWVSRDKWVWNRRSAVFDVETGKMISSFEPPGAYFLDEPQISPDGRHMFLAGNRSVLTPVDTATGKLVRDVPDHILGIERLMFTPDGHTLLVGSRDKRQAWNVDTGKPGSLFEKWYHMPHIAAVNNSLALVSGIKGGGIRLQNIATGAVERNYESVKNEYFLDVQLSVDRKTFVGVESLWSGQIRRWNVADGRVVSERQLPKVDVERKHDTSQVSRGLTLGGSRVIRLKQVVPASKRPDGSIDWGRAELILEDWASQIVTNRLPLPAMGRFACADNGEGTILAAVVSDDQSPPGYGERWGSTHLLVWDVATGWERLRIDREMHNYFGAFSMVAVTRDGRLVATVSDRDRIEIWNGLKGYELDAFDAGGSVTALAFSDDGTMLATGHEDGRVLLWNARLAWDQTVMRSRMNQKMAQQFWKDLAGEGRKPALAWQTLLGSPEQAVEMLASNLQQAVTAKGIVGALETALVPVANAGQEPLDTVPIPPLMRVLRQAVDQAVSEDARKRYESLLDSASRPMLPEARRPILGILLAEQLNTTKSRKLLEQIAAGAAGAFETQVAKAALIRLRLRDDLRDNPVGK